jgi:hypothetical protein
MGKKLFGALQTALLRECGVVEQELAGMFAGLWIRQEEFIEGSPGFLRKNPVAALQQPSLHLGLPIALDRVAHRPTSEASF